MEENQNEPEIVGFRPVLLALSLVLAPKAGGAEL